MTNTIFNIDDVKAYSSNEVNAIAENMLVAILAERIANSMECTEVETLQAEFNRLNMLTEEAR